MPREALDAPDDLRKQALSQPAYAALKRRIQKVPLDAAPSGELSARVARWSI